MVSILNYQIFYKFLGPHHRTPFLSIMIFCLLSIGAPAWGDEICKTLVLTKCIDCHFETRICQKIQKNKGKRSWKRTIKSMVRHGTKLNKEEQKVLVQCFVTRDTSILSLCGMDK